MEKMTKNEILILKSIVRAEKGAEERELEEMEQKEKKTVFELSAIIYKKGYILKLERILDKMSQ